MSSITTAIENHEDEFFHLRKKPVIVSFIAIFFLAVFISYIMTCIGVYSHSAYSYKVNVSDLQSKGYCQGFGEPYEFFVADNGYGCTRNFFDIPHMADDGTRYHWWYGAGIVFSIIFGLVMGGWMIYAIGEVSKV